MTSMIHTNFSADTAPIRTVLQVKGLCGGPGDQLLFNQLTLKLPPGVSALLGNEGTGKTSLMRLISGDLIPKEGLVFLTDETTPLALPRPSAIFWIDLRLPLHDNDTPAQCWANLRPLLPDWSDEIQTELTDVLQLKPHLNKSLNMLSTGSRRKVGLIAALASGAIVTLLDQPFASLDQASIRNLQIFLNKLCQNPHRAWLIADYVQPASLQMVSVLEL